MPPKEKEREQYKIGEEDKVELFQNFFETMIDFDYTPHFIGRELAYVSRALELSREED